MKILVTGGAGYIGSHTCISLLESGHSVIIVDNLSNSSLDSIKGIEKISGKHIKFYKQDLCNIKELSKIFDTESVDLVIHFAGLKSVSESVRLPIEYYRNNLESTLSLCEVMSKHGVKKLIFSSSATVYGTPVKLPIMETSPIGIGITNPYGQTKFMIEQILKDLSFSDNSWKIVSLRYFNPIGAHKSGLIGENPKGLPNNLMPYVSRVASGELEQVNIYGGDYPTKDGTGVRDYIHVMDLAEGHLAALNHLENIEGGYIAYNLGSGEKVSVLEAIDIYQKVSGKNIKYEIVDRRLGDIAECYADTTKAEKELGWKSKRSFEQACIDMWRWQQNISIN